MIKGTGKNVLKRFLAIVVCSFFIGFFVSAAIAGILYFKSDVNKGEILIDSQNISTDYKVIEENNSYFVSKSGGKVIITFPEEVYINKLQYQYSVLENIEEFCNVTIFTKNIYGDKTKMQISDVYMAQMPRSVMNIRKEVSRIVFDFPEINSEIELQNFTIDNTFKLNPYIMAFVSGLCFLILYLIVFRKENAKYPGIATFVCILVTSICILILQPPYCSGWDEQIHFRRSYNLAYTGDKEGAPYVVNFFEGNAHWLNFHQEESMEERLDLMRIINDLGENYGDTIEPYYIGLNSAGYIFQAVAITLGKMLGLPFYIIWMMGKFANLLLYAIGMGVAVSIVPIGKRVLSVVSLLPTMVFSSTVYTYDVTVNVFIILGICIWIKEATHKDEIFTYKWRVAFIVCMIIGCMPKAVYAPLVLCVLFLSPEKFYSKKDQYIFKASVIFCFLLLMSTFVLPTLLAPSVEGDTRGGNTSVALQLRYVLMKPLSYAVVLWNSFSKQFWSSIIGHNGISSFAYLGTPIQSYAYSALIMGVIFSDSYREKDRSFTIKCKLVSLGVICATIVLIWTALYLSFTEVGNVEIVGVQGRYYLPFLFLIYMCLRTEKVKNEYNIEKYQMYVMYMSVFLLLYQTVEFFLLPHCL